MARNGTRKTDKTNRIKDAYLKKVGPEDRGRFPLEGYAALLSIYTVLYLALYKAAEKKGGIPERIDFRDLALLGLATHKLSRHVTKDLVTSAIRSPFTEFAESTGESELYERSRGKGFTYAFADLITCPWCLGGWIAMLGGFGLALNPKFTRMAAGIFSIEAIADFLHVGYDILKKIKHS